jgi:hypothetical protein
MYYGLDTVGTVVWRAIEPQGTLRQALDRVVAEFETDETSASADILDLAAQLVDTGLWTAS